MRIRQNPLLSWTELSRPSAESIDSASRPMYSKNAPAVFTKYLEKVDLNIHVFVGKPNHIAWDHIHQCLDNNHVVLQFVEPFRVSLSRNWGQFENIPRAAPLESIRLPDGTRIAFPKIRLAPMTPFTLLHRFGDALQAHYYSFSTWNVPTFHELTDQRLSVVINSGVGTWAGRNNALISFGEAASDLWAKYLLTGRIHYNPDATPLDWHPWSKKEYDAREEFAEQLRMTFTRWHSKLKKGGIFIISVT